MLCADIIGSHAAQKLAEAHITIAQKLYIRLFEPSWLEGGIMLFE